MVHAFNPSGACPKENYRTVVDSCQAQSYSEVSWRQDHHFQTEVKVRASGWLHCFSVLQVEPHFLSLIFINHASVGAQHGVIERSNQTIKDMLNKQKKKDPQK